MKITALSSYCVDIFPELDKVYVGGNSLNFVSQCKLSGTTNVSSMGAVGNDQFGSLIEKYLDRLEIDRSHLYRMDFPTASNTIYISKQGDRYFKAHSWNGGAFDKFRLSNKDWDYLKTRDIIAIPAGDPNLKDMLRKRNANQLVVVDFLDYHSLDFINNLIDRIDITFLSASEKMLNGLENLASKSRKLIVATMGANGSVAYYKFKKYFQNAVKVDNIVDTTGCGDAFQAAFVIEWYKSQNIDLALQAGSIAASNVLKFVGGVNS
ncbi:MAG: carbohydrate kinase family protein [Flavobacteriaceae bacterium]|nr:carbohydrate kinase family protein [Bacteroidia bacterium]NNL16735.1 carbohydrate kinase family protein [Flavobacteriaceae bacterium]